MVFALFSVPPVRKLHAQEFRELLAPSAAALSCSQLTNTDDRQLMRYALEFSGLTGPEALRYLTRYDTIAEDLDEYLASAGLDPKNSADREKTAEAVLEFLYDGILKKYSFRETRLDVLLDSGVYNCVSSAVLYYALVSRQGIPVRGVRTADHAFCAVTAGGKSIDVETTNKYGFDPGNKKEFTNAFGQTGFVYTPPGHYRSRTDLDGRELVCLILLNDIAEAQQKRDFSSSVRSAAGYYAALGTEEALAQLYNECVNYAGSLDTKRQYEAALDFLTQAAQMYGPSGTLSDTADKIYYNLFAACLGQGGADRQARVAQADRLYAAHEKNPLVSSKMKNNVLVMLYNQKAQILLAGENWTELFALLERAGRDMPGDPRTEKLGNDIRYNISVVFHNKFAALFNRGERDTALAVLEEGLALVPDSSLLLNDYKRATNAP